MLHHWDIKKQVVESNIPSISRRVFLDLAGSVAKAFEGSGEGPTFTDPMRHAVIHDALEMLLTPPKDREQKAQAIFSTSFRDGSKKQSWAGIIGYQGFEQTSDLN